MLCWGAEAAVYRTDLYAPYHADRPPMPPELERQWRDAPDFFGAFGWRSVADEELEADDLLGSFAEIETAAGGRTLILTGDRDMFQCATENVHILMQQARKGFTEMGPDEVRERYGIGPELVPDFIALRGDPSDGLPGAKGIGAKTARDLLRRHGTLEDVIAAAGRPGTMTPRMAGALTGDRDMFQCVGDAVTVLFPRGGKDGPEAIGPAEVRERYGIEPAQVPDFIALRGDPSDGLPGAKGIGAKTAADILQRKGDLEHAVLGAIREKPSVRRALIEQADELRSFKEIATLVEVELDTVKDRESDWAGGAKAARELGMNRLAERLDN